MKTTDKGNRGTPLDYAVPGTDEELLLFDYRKFTFYVGNTGRYRHLLNFYFSHQPEDSISGLLSTNGNY